MTAISTAMLVIFAGLSVPNASLDCICRLAVRAHHTNMWSVEKLEVGVCCHPRPQLFVDFFQQLDVVFVVALHYGPGLAVTGHGALPQIEACGG